MVEYKNRDPDSHGRREASDPAGRRFRLGPQRVAAPSVKIATIASLAAPHPTPPPVAERPRRPLVDRSPREISDDVAAQLAASPFIDASGVSITIDGSDVTLEGTINSLIAVALSKALASNVPGVGRVQVQLRVQQAPRSYETATGIEDGGVTPRPD